MSSRYGMVMGILLVAAAITTAFFLMQSPKTAVPTSSEHSQDKAHPTRSVENLSSNSSAPSSAASPSARHVKQLMDAVQQRLRAIHESETVDLGKILDDLDNNGVRRLSAEEIFQVIESVNFSNKGDDAQGAYFVLETIAEILRNKTTKKDVAWVYAKFESATTDSDQSKWFKVLETVAHAGNQAGYIALLDTLPQQVTDEKTAAKAEMVGRILGRIGTTETIQAALAAADDRSEAKQLAVERAVGYVQNTAALPAITEIIEGGKASSHQLEVAMRMLGHIPSEYSVLSLQKLATDSDPQISQIASKALAQLIENNPGLKTTK